jgi:hypothetical protein
MSGWVILKGYQIQTPNKRRLFEAKLLRLKFETFDSSSIIFNHGVACN